MEIAILEHRIDHDAGLCDLLVEEFIYSCHLLGTLYLSLKL